MTATRTKPASPAKGRALQVVSYETPMIPLRVIEANPDNPRHNAVATEELVESVRKHGVLQPVVVQPIGAGDDGYRLIAGHRRLDAARRAGLSDVPAHVRTGDDNPTVVELMLVENLHRENLSPLEEAEGFRTLAELGRTQKQIADMVGVSQPLVSKRLTLLRLPDVARAAVDKGRDDGGISIEEAVAIAVLPDNEITALFEKGNPSSYQVGDAVRRHTEAKKRAKVIAELKAKGVTVITKAPGWNAAHPPVRLGYLIAGVDREAHAALDCHVVYVDETGYTTACCTAPENHPTSTDEPEADEEEVTPSERAEIDRRALEDRARGRGRTVDEQLAFEARQQMLEADQERRLEFCRALIHRPCTNDIVALAAHVLPEAQEIGLAGALDLLGVVKGNYTEQIRQAQDFAGDDCRTQVQTLYAITLASSEGMAVEGFREMARAVPVGDEADSYLPITRRYLKHLSDHGHQLSELEGELLAEQQTLDETEPESDPEPEPDPVEEPAPAISVTKKGKRWIPSCSACGALSAGNTTEEFADMAGVNHLSVAHGIGDGV